MAASTGTPADRPPRPRLGLVVGVTGHRPPALDIDRAFAEREQLRSILSCLAAAAVALGEAEPALDATGFEPALVSSLAEGADQIAAQVASELGFRLRVVLPLPRDDYRTDFGTQGAALFDALLDDAAHVLELPQQPNGRDESYALAGRGIVAQCDMLVALWDGAPARGPGGTAENVALALRHGVPVIHLPVGDPQPGRILWSGYGDFVDPDDLDALPTREAEPAALRELVAAILGPPTGPGRGDLGIFLNERARRTLLRPEWPLLLAMLGVRPLRRTAFRSPDYEAATHDDWRPFRELCGNRRHGVAADSAGIERAFAWADQLAQHYAQTYRSGHVLNFALAGLAVLLALSGLLLPQLHAILALAEPAAIAAFVINTFVGTHRQWHRRWLEYRQLAERLRPMRSLRLLGVTAAPAMRQSGDTGWVAWYARAQWRAAGCPVGTYGDAPALIAAITAQEIAPQIAYHRANARQMHRLDERLHRLGMLLFSVTILSCLTSILANLFAPELAHDHALGFVAVSAGLPAIGAAIFGIRMQGDFGGTAQRSLVTADELERITRALAATGINLSRRCDLIEAAAATMLSELGQWRCVYEQRRLELPG